MFPSNLRLKTFAAIVRYIQIRILRIARSSDGSCQGVQEDSKAADSLKRDFTRLRRQVKTFAESWAQGITRNGDALSKEIQKLLDDIKVTQDGLTW